MSDVMRRELVTVGIDVITLELGMSPSHMPNKS